ncbi:hypothetical protein Anacy_4708 [Anabaena cylindrica PCC 7122]|uniref:Uncharacterized protein n=1 Tax=Anabaena cylindrica (strain ATCC 27899 / PCC 7122) TaxID=272123 RepID=K9ZMN6_ANACC|nr:hypothetical protein Anacy_4708 [Anabaena cylindrica PCC 7122]BAY02882.1 hypothetical protein NIES19_21310 [Anabaena cylindrica PCC 7122]
MFPTVLDVLNISVFIFGESIKIINFDVLKCTIVENQSFNGVILCLFTKLLRDSI